MKNDQNEYWGLDSNIIIYLIDIESPFHEPCLKALEDHPKNNYITQQNINETLSTLVNSYKKDPLLSLETIQALISNPTFELVCPNEKTGSVFNKLISQTKTKNIHDCYLAATYLSNGINCIFSNNKKDFKVFTDLIIITP